MINGKKLLALVPARGGSKRLPGKNIIDFYGKPLIAWTIEAALLSKYVDRVVVSTEDKEIAEISKEYGAEVPFIRPSILASDRASTIDVVIHAITTLSKFKDEYEYIILLQPTSPLRSFEDINNSVELLTTTNSEAVISVCETEHSPLWCNTLPESKSLERFLDKKLINKRSQELDIFYRLNGSIYLCRTDRIVKENTFFIEDKIIAYIMAQESSVDIDTTLDLMYASAVMKNSKNS
jgi:CMP-N,N'-diacetyllegionaminic acid synthase